ncbi:hypothetical protein D3C72_2555600 [compost metagenome]
MELLLADGEILFFGGPNILIAIGQFGEHALRQVLEHFIAAVELHAVRRDHFGRDGALA